MSECLRKRVWWAVAMLPALLSGCALFPHDVTNRLREEGIVGRCLETTQETPVWRDRQFGWLTLGWPHLNSKGVEGPVGSLPKGTRLYIYKAEEHLVYFDGVFSETDLFLFARLEEGSFRGKQIEVSQAAQNPADLVGFRLISTTQPAPPQPPVP